MSEPLPSLELPAAGPPRFARLSPRSPGPAGSPGCVALLGLPLLLLGGGVAAVPFLGDDPFSESWVALVVGLAFGLVGLLLVWGAIRGARARSLPPPEVALEKGVRPRPGGAFHVRVRQPGPVALESLHLALTCERRYRRQVRRNSTAKVDDSELRWERELLRIGGERVPAGGVLERVIGVEIPPDAEPTGPARPDGRIRWTLELSVEAGLLRGWRTDFEIEVGGAA
jgi:hypothetical protein